jgi:hypothetical protein
MGALKINLLFVMALAVVGCAKPASESAADQINRKIDQMNAISADLKGQEVVVALKSEVKVSKKTISETKSFHELVRMRLQLERYIDLGHDVSALAQRGVIAASDKTSLAQVEYGVADAKLWLEQVQSRLAKISSAKGR